MFALSEFQPCSWAKTQWGASHLGPEGLLQLPRAELCGEWAGPSGLGRGGVEDTQAGWLGGRQWPELSLERSAQTRKAP